MKGKLILEDGSQFEGQSFGTSTNTAGEVVFSTGMVGYPESLTDPSYLGQILVLTYPLIGNYGVPEKKYWESDSIKVSGLIVSNYICTPSHFQSKMTLASWLKRERVPALEITDTRYLTQKIRAKGTMLGKIIVDDPEQSRRVDINFYDPNKENLVAKVSTKKTSDYTPRSSTPRLRLEEVGYDYTWGEKQKIVILIDCGAKKNIERCLLKRGVRVINVPWDFDPFVLHPRGAKLNFNAIVISNGPGDPKMADKTIQTIKKALDKKIPILGVCLGHQLLALAAGGDTTKLKFGHRSQNQPCILQRAGRLAGRSLGEGRCFITTQNHGFAVNKIPHGFKSWFTNANDNSNEGIIHETLPFMSVQFHPEAHPGPNDTEWVFDFFLEKIKSLKLKVKS